MICWGWTWITKKGKELRPANLPSSSTHLFQTRLFNLTQQPRPGHGLHLNRVKRRLCERRCSTSHRLPTCDRLKMGYPCQVFHASELPERVQTDLKGRKRKLESGVRNVDLTGCELLEMLQYKCEIKEPVKWDSPVQCYAVDRLFRK